MVKAFLLECLRLLLAMGSALQEGWSLLRRGWRWLLGKVYEKMTGTVPETSPSLFEVLLTLKVVVSGLPKKLRIAAYAGGISAVLVVVLLVGAAVHTVQTSSGGGSGGGGIQIGGHTYYQPEFSKLDCLTCGGDGDCNTCNGYGEVERYAGGGDTVRAKCSSCYGSGNCRTCGGSGKR